MNTGICKDVRFLGLAVPGARGIPPTQDLVAVWHHTAGERFQNYKAVFTILDVGRLSRAWLHDVKRGDSQHSRLVGYTLDEGVHEILGAPRYLPAFREQRRSMVGGQSSDML